MPAAFPPLDPEYDDFLYAVVCNEKNGMQLTIASAIARSGADPWKEAARISKMPKDMALQVLTRLMPDQSTAEREMIDVQITADRLFSLLPKGRYAPIANTIAMPRAKGAGVVLVLAFCTAVMFAYLFAIALRPDAGLPGTATSVAAPVENTK